MWGNTILNRTEQNRTEQNRTEQNRTDTLLFKNFYITEKDRRVMSVCKIRSRHGGLLFLNVFAKTSHFSHAKMRFKNNVKLTQEET